MLPQARHEYIYDSSGTSNSSMVSTTYEYYYCRNIRWEGHIATNLARTNYTEEVCTIQLLPALRRRVCLSDPPSHNLASLLPCYNDATCTVGETQAVISTEATSQVQVAFIRYAEDLLFCYTRSGVDMLQADTKKMEPHPTSRLCSLLSADMTCIRS